MRNRLNSFVLFFFFFFKKVSVIFHREKSISFNNVTRSSMIIDRVIPFRPNSPMTPVNQTRIEYQSTNRKGLKPSSRLQFQLDVRAPHVDRIVANNDAHLYLHACVQISMYLCTTTRDARYLSIEFWKTILEIENSLNISRASSEICLSW